MKKLFECVIPGRPASKKNNQKVVWKNGRAFKIDTPAYRQWHAIAQREMLLWSRPTKPIEKPVILKIDFYMNKRQRVDISNLYEGIQDLLVEMNVLADDNCTVVIGHDGSRVYYDKENPRMRVTIYEVKEWLPWSSTTENA